MAIHRKEDLIPDSNENGITMTSLSGPERGDKMITVKELFLEPGAEIPVHLHPCLLYTSPSPRDAHESRMPSSA